MVCPGDSNLELGGHYSLNSHSLIVQHAYSHRVVRHMQCTLHTASRTRSICRSLWQQSAAVFNKLWKKRTGTCPTFYWTYQFSFTKLLHKWPKYRNAKPAACAEAFQDESPDKDKNGRLICLESAIFKVVRRRRSRHRGVSSWTLRRTSVCLWQMLGHVIN